MKCMGFTGNRNKKLTPLTLKSGVCLNLCNLSIHIRKNSWLNTIARTVHFPVNISYVCSYRTVAMKRLTIMPRK